jgi:hypothetical protein
MTLWSTSSPDTATHIPFVGTYSLLLCYICGRLSLTEKYQEEESKQARRQVSLYFDGQILSYPVEMTRIRVCTKS